MKRNWQPGDVAQHVRVSSVQYLLVKHEGAHWCVIRIDTHDFAWLSRMRTYTLNREYTPVVLESTT